MPTDALARTLSAVATVMAAARDPWWIIGSAAVVLHGADTNVADVDVMLSVRDADAVAATLGIGLGSGGGSEVFRSARYGRWNEPLLPVEFMADLHVGTVIRPLLPETRMAVRSGTAILFVPDVGELIAILTRFGRTKDLRRAELLRALRR